MDQFHQENERSRRDLGIDFYIESNDLVKNNQDNNFNDIELTKTDCITVNRDPSSKYELSTKNYIDDELVKNTILRFNQKLENYLKVSISNDTYNLTKYDKKQIFDVTEIRSPNTGDSLLSEWGIKKLNKNISAKIGDF